MYKVFAAVALDLLHTKGEDSPDKELLIKISVIIRI